MGFFTSASKEKDEKKNQELLEMLEKHPLVEQIVKEKQDEIISKRTAAAGTIAQLEKARDKKLPILQEKLNEAEVEYNRIRGELKAAENKYQQARINLWSERGDFERDIEAQTVILLDSYDERISEAQEFFRLKIDWLRNPDRIRKHNAPGERNIFTDKTPIVVSSNLPAINAAMEYARAAIAELESMKFKPDFDNERVEELKAGIPSIDVLIQSDGVYYSSHKPYFRAPRESMTDSLLRRARQLTGR